MDVGDHSVLGFARQLRAWNASRAEGDRARVYGLDLYSLYGSIRAVLDYLDDVDPEAARIARTRYACLTPWEQDPAAYGAAAVSGGYDGCADEVVRILDDLLRRRLEYASRDGERFFNAARNAMLVKSAERYYRTMYCGSNASWNLRDTHMHETLLALLEEHGPESRAVVWAHNSHLGNAAATSMGARGQTNLGALCRSRFAERCYAVGFGTDHGTVAAADEWGGPMEVMNVRPAHEASYERVCHDSRIAHFMLPLRLRDGAVARTALSAERLERAIGVIYRPATELASHYFHASLPKQFDEWIWFDETRAVVPLPVPTSTEDAPETFPFGV
jgi:protein-L-isoaspartate(D-aspartate) O-methyltransferase